MAYIEWNGKSSESIPGLLICELPPITKPKMRTSVTKIDGRDGDIVEDLGYENGSFFRTIFKKRYGKNPLDYRKGGII